VAQSLVLVFSALGETTNALEEVVQAYFEPANTWRQKLDAIREFHVIIASDLLPESDMFLDTILRPSFDALARKLEKPPAGSFDFLYDQVVSMGEIWSTLLVHHYLLETGLDFRFINIRENLITDSNYREGRVDWDQSGFRIRKEFAFTGKEKYVTQGFIAGTENGIPQHWVVKVLIILRPSLLISSTPKMLLSGKMFPG
jgi:aspartate kinase